jgi:bifunctional UDP-N-acetylglucosamine pyrophosphorylase / glucosamine-1-phosphate N-acetyltransferase
MLQPLNTSAAQKAATLARIIRLQATQRVAMTGGLTVVIMAAGKGTRMRSARPKVLHTLAGRALLDHVVHMTSELQAQHVVLVTGHEAERVQAHVAQTWPAASIVSVRQEPQLGTGHAVQQAVPHLRDDAIVLVLSGDVPLTRVSTLQSLLALTDADPSPLALLTVQQPNPTGYGRIVRDATGAVRAIVEEKDATTAQRRITEVYSGILAAPAVAFKRWLGQLTNHNAQAEYYLTDVVAHAVAQGWPVRTHTVADHTEVDGVNNPAQLATLERAAQARTAAELMAQGVRLADPTRLDVRGTLQCGTDVEIDIGCVFEGDVHLADGVRVGPYCVLRHVHVQAGATLAAYTHIEGASASAPVRVGPQASVGPFARLRPGTELGAQVHVGNFVEIKNSQLAAGAKANHLAYLGDATVGERVNYGAGSITANYDGAHKHRTILEADVHVGSNCVLVAPVTVGAGGTVGAGSIVTRDTAAQALTVTRVKPTTIANWKRPRKD